MPSSNFVLLVAFPHVGVSFKGDIGKNPLSSLRRKTPTEDGYSCVSMTESKSTTDPEDSQDGTGPRPSHLLSPGNLGRANRSRSFVKES